ncbi:nucleotidyltransferase family protein [Methanocorpusculum sp. MG]|uniref:Nucleotidyltransferase family protein n=1 Tax=Methanocorpusculum petauri TaxID=3002863 RepID=A0ABT4IEJ5_9EURY|nr:nucleotidyltransferase family protein [Methanocorpusculum petauri]MCZ0860155.1 nucleotidyltransferase family protein [Methanocorpusculum petauri]MCZ9313328.1 nucleotidyltransferase family protein [Methanocorpusculum sp.]
MPEYTSIKDTVLQKLEENLPEIRKRFGIEKIGIFGSVSRSEDRPDSDIDILYLFEKGRGGMNDIIPLMQYLENLLGRKVDMVSMKYISPFLEPYIRADAIICGSAET